MPDRPPVHEGPVARAGAPGRPRPDGRLAMSRPAVFLDRDGTIVEDADYLASSDEMRVFPWAARAIRALNEAGYAVVVVTNQSGVARGLLEERQVEEIHAALTRALAEDGAAI